MGDPVLDYSAKTLCDLGRPTKRGIKKCPKCGIYNGTRGIICKNKRCDAVLKDCTDKRKVSLDAVLLVGIVRQIYSVRVRDRGPDYRGFVQLPFLSQQNGDRGVVSENALCFVDSCRRLFDDSILKCHEMEPHNPSPLCVHIDSAIKSQSTATPVEFKQEILSLLNVSDEIKRKLWVLATEKEGPLVQRVSRTAMVVKCQVSPKHPLGYLHFTFGCTKGKESYDKYYCSCTEFMVSGKSSNIKLKCVHYYACICALFSDGKCCEEFVQFINYELSRGPVNGPGKAEKAKKCNKIVPQKVQKHSSEAKDNLSKIQVSFPAPVQKRAKRWQRLAPKIFPIEIKVLETERTSYLEDTTPSWKFLEWLTYVTDSINQTMHFENYGNLNTLVFCIPENFYEEFRKRIPEIYTESQQFPNVYHVMNISHLKEIFDTSEVKLKISKRFVHDDSRGYIEYNENDENDPLQLTFIFFLNVGQSTVDESDNTNNAFAIEWTPKVSSPTKVGQLKFQYKYGRKST